MILKYETFIKQVADKFNEEFTKSEILEILNNAFEFEKDNPVSTGKRLIMDKLIVKGIKSNGDKIDFQYPMYGGINLLVADNLKGKSSIFKIIKFALTGNRKIKADVRKWIKEIMLSFQINERKYTIILNLKSRSLVGKLYSKDLDTIDELSDEPILEGVGIQEYADKIQDFFFKQFSYYSLKWTQKASQKGRVELKEARASWKTYFKSIYLESQDSSTLMYGGQGKKIFQMLMGLELTYVINYLTVMKEKLEFEIGKNEAINSDGTSNKSLLKSLNNRIDAIKAEINQISEECDKKYRISNLYKEYDDISNMINKKREEVSCLNKEVMKASEDKEVLEVEMNSYRKEFKRVEREINKGHRNINDIEEYLEIGVFFSDLNIKQCPSCNKEVLKHVSIEKDSIICPLCHDEIEEGNYRNNGESQYIIRLEELRALVQELKKEKIKLLDKINHLSKEINNYNMQIEKLEAEINTINKGLLEKKLTKIEEKINEIRLATKSIREKEIELSSEKAILEYRIKEMVKNSDKNINVRKVKLLEYAIKILIQMRFEKSKKILDNLQKIMLNELHCFGLHTISEIRITPNYDIQYKQDGEFIKFDDIAEGEQLRAKLAFYLGIMQLDIDKNFGRHTRFLIIDSPNKEEGDSKYLTGLKDVLKDIDERYGKDLQILIGTATRSLSNIVENEKIFEEGEFVF